MDSQQASAKASYRRHASPRTAPRFSNDHLPPQPKRTRKSASSALLASRNPHSHSHSQQGRTHSNPPNFTFRLSPKHARTPALPALGFYGTLLHSQYCKAQIGHSVILHCMSVRPIARFGRACVRAQSPSSPVSSAAGKQARRQARQGTKESFSRTKAPSQSQILECAGSRDS
jgi:hypothetical protein